MPLVISKLRSTHTTRCSTPATARFTPYASLAAAYALLGKMDEAKPYVAETLRLNPNFTVKWLREHAIDIPIRNEGLRKALVF